MSIKSNWEQGISSSNYHFDWSRRESSSYDYAWLGRFDGDWSKEIQKVLDGAVEKTWRTRSKRQNDEQYQLEENDLINAGMDKETVILRKYYDVEPIFQKMIDHTGLEDTQSIFHVQHPGEMLNLHIDKQYEYNEDETKTARIIIFLDDWKPGQFFQMGTSYIQWTKGDMIWFDWKSIPHASANAGWDKRPLLMITGTITEKTKQLFLPNHKLIKV